MFDRDFNELSRRNGYIIYKKNLKTLLNASGIAAILLFLLWILSLFLKPIHKNHALYMIMMILFAGIFLISKLVCSKYKKMVTPTVYLYLASIFILGIILGTVYTPDGYAVSFCVLFFALPQLFIDKPIRLIFFQSMIEIIFCIMTYHIKTLHFAVIDMVNTISFFLISIPLNYSIIKTKLGDIDNQRKIIWQNERDGLTQIYNKDTTTGMIEQRMLFTHEEGALMVIDIDDFKGINDQYGHQMGDEAIKFVANCIAGSLRTGDVVGRFGGDEFIVYMVDVNNGKNAVRKAEEFRNKIHVSEMIQEEFRNIRCSISVGIALYPKDGNTYAELFKHADKALYQAKRKGKNQVALYGEIVEQSE